MKFEIRNQESHSRHSESFTWQGPSTIGQGNTTPKTTINQQNLSHKIGDIKERNTIRYGVMSGETV